MVDDSPSDSSGDVAAERDKVADRQDRQAQKRAAAAVSDADLAAVRDDVQRASHLQRRDDAASMRSMSARDRDAAEADRLEGLRERVAGTDPGGGKAKARGVVAGERYLVAKTRDTERDADDIRAAEQDETYDEFAAADVSRLAEDRSLDRERRADSAMDRHAALADRFAADTESRRLTLLSEQLQASEARYRLLAENASDVVWQLDAQGLMRWVSPSVTWVLGWDVEQLLGTDPVELVHPDDHQVFDPRRTSAYEGETVAAFEVRIRKPDGQYRWISAQSRATTDTGGAVTGLIVGVRDVHERVLARQRLVETARELAVGREVFRLAVEGAPQGLAVLGLELEFVRANPALSAMLGRSEAWLLTHALRDVVNHDDRDDCAKIEELLSPAGPSRIVQEQRWLRADGLRVPPLAGHLIMRPFDLAGGCWFDCTA
ncbi:MAG: PAS domain S-box protein, partial [Actinobacteria bacterium]|nr:PAS domain S-box protein [Actinomycetota bacterium]